MSKVSSSLPLRSLVETGILFLPNRGVCVCVCCCGGGSGGVKAEA
jgi:hypothetical protein